MVFPPTKEKLRGRWDYSVTANRDKSTGQKAMAMATPVIPGMIVLLDTTRSIGQIVDPLGETQEGRSVMAAINGVIEKYPAEFDGQQRPHPPQTHQLGEDGIKTWAHFMRQLLDTDYATQAGGQPLPSKSEIAKWPGRRARDPMNSGPQEEKLARWVDVVPVDGATERAGK